MLRTRVAELHYITPIENIGTILEYGILSHNLAERIPHQSVALAEVQERRQGKRVPGGRPLHDYANLYFDARNPMMFLRKDGWRDLMVVRVSPTVLDLEGVAITDGNAASDGTRFYAAPGGVVELDETAVYAEWWTDPDPWMKQEKKRMRCAEVLV